MLSSKPTKSFFYLTRHLSNVVVLMSQNLAGAIMIAHASTILASYLFAEERCQNKKRTDKEIYYYLRSFIWEMNMGLRSGAESCFTNLTLEFGGASPEIANEYIVWGGELLEERYSDIPPKYFNRINEIIINIMKKGAGKGVPFTFPLITVPITDDFDWDNKMFACLLENMYSWGGCYFENFQTKPFEDEYYKKLNPKIQPRDPSITRSLCCRLSISKATLSKIGWPY